MQIKTTMCCDLTPVRRAIINKSTKQVLARMWRKGNPFLHCWWECRLWKAVWRYLKNLQWIWPWPSNPTSGNISEGTQNTNSQEHKHPYVHCSITNNCQDMEAAQVSISRWVGKTTMGHLHDGILLRHKRKETFTLCDSTGGPREYYAKWTKPVRERQMPYDFTQVWNLRNKLN